MKKSYFFAIFSIMLLASCSSIKVTTDLDKSVDFSKYKTFEYYGWAENSDKILNQFDKDRIEKAFGNEFNKRNLELVKENGDLVVTLYIVTKEKTQTTAHTDHYGGGRGYMGYYGHGPGWGYGSGYGMGHSTTTVHEYDYVEGTLVVSVYDKKNEKLIWESVGVKTVDSNPETRDKSVPKSVEAIMREFPVKPLQQ